MVTAKKRAAVVLLALLIAGAAAYPLVVRAANAREAAVAARAFFDSLAAVDITGAREHALGNVAARLASRQDTPERVAIVGFSARPLEAGPHWAKLWVAVETRSDDGEPDMNWYFLGMVKEADGWKVYEAEPAPPMAFGVGKVPSGVPEEAAACFEGYLNALARNDYRAAGKSLVGAARRAHEAAEPVLAKGPVVRKIESLTLTPVWEKGPMLVTQAGYVVDGRDVKVLVTFWRTGRGWRIADVEQT